MTAIRLPSPLLRGAAAEELAKGPFSACRLRNGELPKCAVHLLPSTRQNAAALERGAFAVGRLIGDRMLTGAAVFRRKHQRLRQAIGSSAQAHDHLILQASTHDLPHRVARAGQGRERPVRRARGIVAAIGRYPEHGRSFDPDGAEKHQRKHDHGRAEVCVHFKSFAIAFATKAPWAAFPSAL